MKLKKIFLLLVLFTLLVQASETIKIVYNSGTPPFKFTDKNNQANGLLIDIWKLWAKKNNHDITFIEASWDDTLTFIQNGKADIHAGIYHTQQRETFLDYTKTPLYKNKKYFFYHKELLDIESPEDFKPYVIAIDNGYPSEFMKKNYQDFSIIQSASSNEVGEMFASGKVKVALASLPTLIYYLQSNNKQIEEYRYGEHTYAYTKEYFGAVKKGNHKLLETINKGFENITPQELQEIEKKWTQDLTSSYLKNQIQIQKKSLLTKKQKEYLKNKEKIKMCVDPSWLPIEAIEDQKHIGILADIYKELDRLYPIKRELIITKTWEESINKMKTDQCDFLSATGKTKEREKFLNFTEPLLSFPLVIVTREKEPFFENFSLIMRKKIGVVKNSSISGLVKLRYPNSNFYFVTNTQEGLYKVRSGELFGFINTSATASYAISKHGMNDLKIAAKIDIPYPLAIGVNKNQPELLNIFNTLIKKVNSKMIQDIKENWISVNVQEVFDYTFLYKIIAIFLVIIVIVLYWNRKLNLEIREKKRLAKELHKISQVVEQSPVSVIIANLEGTIEYVNQFCCHNSGYTQEELLGNNPRILKSGYQGAEFYEKLWETISSGNIWQGEFSNLKKDGTIFWESAVIAPIFNHKGKISYYTSIKEDITEKVNTRVSLQEAQEEAQKANNAKSDFLAKMSHEIRTPMNAILGMLYLLQKTQITMVQENYIKKSHHAANALLNLINDILDFSKIEAGKLDIKESEFELNTMLHDNVSLLTIQAVDKNVELLANYDTSIPSMLISDNLRIGQILNNLISNAIKFTQHGEIIVTTKLIGIENNKASIMFCVKDSGIGISQEKQSKLFKEFSQVDDSQTRSFHGTGLGLAISKKLAIMLGGDVWIENSVEGVGSTFCFSIKATIGSEKPKIQIDKKKFLDLSILVVDDNSSALEILKTMLESFGYNVQTASNGKDAIWLTKNNSFDIVFLDYMMEPLDGIETYKQMENFLQANKTKVIIVSAYSNEIIDDAINKNGINGYLAKPISPSTLYDTIVTVLSSTQSSNKGIETKNNNQGKKFQGKILLVEDNILNQEFAQEMLTSYGLEVDIANDGIEALEKVKSKKYNLLLMDIQMPNMDGLEATRHIRAFEDDYFKTLPIIALSANALIGDKEKSLQAGMNQHITKPFDPDLLIELLGKYLLSQDKPECQIINTDNQNDINIEKLDTQIFDTKQALRRLNGSTATYIKILKQFRSHYEDVFDIITLYIEKKDIKQAEAKVHEIKGISGNIAATILFEKLTLLDTILKKDQIPTTKLINESKMALDTVMENISKLDNLNLQTKSFDPLIVQELLEKIEKNLDQDIVKAQEYLEELIPYLQTNYKQIADSLEESIEQFDTDEARNIIINFKEQL